MRRATGSSNPRQNSTSRDPYRSDNWLSTGLGWPQRLPTVPAAAPMSPAFAPIQPGAARASYDLAGISARLGPYWKIPLRVDLDILLKIRESIPLIDAAILRMKELIGFPEVEAEAGLKADIDQWLSNMPVNRIQYGFSNWMLSHYDNMFMFGRAHAEIVLTNARDDVFGLVEVHPATTGLRPTLDGYALDVVQYQYGGGVPVTLVPELLLTSVNDFRGDDPNGTSLIASLPFVSEIYQKMLRSLGNTWDRYGVPVYWANWEPPADWNDPQGEQTDQKILAPARAMLYQTDLDKANGKIRHLVTAGKWSLQIMGADGETLEFSETARSIAEQITAKIGLPPFMYGFSWSTAERMSTSQARLLTEIIECARGVVESEIKRLIELRQRLVGRAGPFELAWPKVHLAEEIDTQRAFWMKQQGEAIQLENLQQEGRLGIYSVEEIAQLVRDDLDGLSPEEVRVRLPGLVEEIPPPAPVQIASMRGQQPAGGNNPADEATRAFWRKEIGEMIGNGNGKH